MVVMNGVLFVSCRVFGLWEGPAMQLLGRVFALTSMETFDARISDGIRECHKVETLGVCQGGSLQNGAREAWEGC